MLSGRNFSLYLIIRCTKMEQIPGRGEGRGGGRRREGREGEGELAHRTKAADNVRKVPVKLHSNPLQHKNGCLQFKHSNCTFHAPSTG